MSLYTSGKEFLTLDGVLYEGYYHKIRLLLYTGKRHVFDVSKKLRKILYDLLTLTYYPYAMKYKDFILSLKVNLLLLLLKVINRTQIQFPLQLNLLKHTITNHVYDVDVLTFTNNKLNIMLVSLKVTIKKPQGFSNIIYNRDRIRRIKDRHIRLFVLNMLNRR